MTGLARFRSTMSPTSPGGVLVLAALLLLSLAAGVVQSPVAGAAIHEGTEAVPDPAPSGTAAAHGEATVEFFGLQFVPQILVVEPGTTVTWRFHPQDPFGMSHTVTSGDPATGAQSGPMDSALLAPGDTYEHTFTEEDAGSVITYFCSPHRALGMWGAIVVLPADGDAVGDGEARVEELVAQAEQELEGATESLEEGDGDGGSDGGASGEDEGDGSSGSDAGSSDPGDDEPTDGSDGDGSDEGNETTTSEGTGKGTEDGNTTSESTSGEDGTSGEGSASATVEPVGRTYDVEVDEFTYEPQDLEVLTHDTVHWTNVGSQPHTVTSEDGAFDSGNLDPGEGFEHTFEEPGTYGYVCTYHKDLGQHGTVTVEARDDGGSAGYEESVTPVDGGTDPDEDGTTAEDGTAGDGGSGDADAADDHDHDDHDHGSTEEDATGAEGSSGDEDGTGGPEGGEATDDAPGAGNDATADEDPDLRVMVGEYVFAPENAAVTVGDTVIWVNVGGVPHTVTSADGTLDSGNLDPGEEFRHTFQVPGTYGYVCEYHTVLGQHGNLTVRPVDSSEPVGNLDPHDHRDHDHGDPGSAGDGDAPSEDPPAGAAGGASVDRPVPAPEAGLLVAAVLAAALLLRRGRTIK